MKIKRDKKFITSHSKKETWKIVIGISPREDRIKTERPQYPLQYITIVQYGFFDKTDIPYLYTGILSNSQKQKILIYVVDKNNLIIKKNLNPLHSGMYLFDKNKGNDIWECLYFTDEFSSIRNKKLTQKDDSCSVSIKNICYALIGSNCNNSV